MAVPIAILSGVVILLLSPIFEGIGRKVKAIVHSRQGPPITQTYMDILKLLGKEDVRCVKGTIFRYAPAFALASFLVVGLLIPVGAGTLIPADMITWIYFLTLGGAAILLMAASSGNPFALAGGAREVMMLLSVEPIVVAALITAAMKSGSLRLEDMASWNLAHGPCVSMISAGIAFLLVLQATLAKLPFDTAEAEGEVVGGALVEVSGPNLAVMKLALLVRQFVYSLVLVQIFFPWPSFSFMPLAIAALLVKVLVLFVLAAVVEAVSPRLRVDQAMTYASRVLFVALAALAFAAIGV